MVICAIIGSGLMGCKIAGEFALHGHRVRMYDSDQVILNSVCERMKEDKRDLLNEGLLMQPIFTGSVLCVSRMEDCLRGAELIFEVVPDDWDIKYEVLGEISKHASPSAVIATNTLRLDVEKLSHAVSNPERFLGLRFLFPVYFIPEVEVTLAGSLTCQVSLTLVRTVLESMGKTLFFRSGSEPLILTEDQRKARWSAARDGLWRDCSTGVDYSSTGQITDNQFTQRQMSDGNTQQNFLNSSLIMTHTPGGMNQQFLSSSFTGGTAVGGWLSGSTFTQPSSGSHSNLTTTSTSIAPYHSSCATSNTNTECVICMERDRDCLLEPCRHLILCKTCAKLMLDRKDYCPLCREKIVTVSDVYMS